VRVRGKIETKAIVELSHTCRNCPLTHEFHYSITFLLHFHRQWPWFKWFCCDLRGMEVMVNLIREDANFGCNFWEFGILSSKFFFKFRTVCFKKLQSNFPIIMPGFWDMIYQSSSSYRKCLTTCLKFNFCQNNFFDLTRPNENQLVMFLMVRSVSRSKVTILRSYIEISKIVYCGFWSF